MKKITIAISIVLLSSLYTIKAQDSCKVLMESIKGKYNGDCKKGLANGKGYAAGNDTYEGTFKKGYPNGYGKYTWANGAIYIGNWKMGIRNGEGKYTTKENGKDVELDGIWQNDKYIGVKPIPPTINQKRNIAQANFSKLGEGDNITIKLLQNGLSHNVEELFLVGSSGTQFIEGPNIGFHNCDFPFKGKITYKSWNSLRSILYDRILEFTIPQAGKWEIKVDN